jgi:DNA-binding NarL/FixJ family response regulator
MSKIRVFIADDHGVVRAGLRALIAGQSDLEVAGEAADGRAAVEAIRQLRPDVAVLDLTMPILNGAEAAAQLRRDCPAVKVVVLTIHEDTAYLRQLLEVGVTGYVPKRAAGEDLIAAIRAVIQGGTYLHPTVAKKLVQPFVGRQTGANALGPDLSDREREVTILMVRGHTNKEIAAQLGISVKTVEAHKKNAFTKLGFRTRAELVQYAVEQRWLEKP